MCPKEKKDYYYLLENNLEPGKYSICACGESAPALNQIKRFEEEIGYELPEDFVDFSISSLGGIYVEVKEEFWPRAKQYEVGPFWSFLYGVIVYGFSEAIPEWMDIRLISRDFKEETESDYVPFMQIIGDADRYCFGKDEKIYLWSHETWEYEPVDKTFLELLDYELGELDKRKDRKIELLNKKKES